MSTETAKHLRAAYRADPDAFDRLIREYLEQGPDAFAAPRPGANAGRPESMNDDVRALFLAQFLNRNESQSARALAQAIADKAEFWRVDGSRYGVIDNENTVRRHARTLKKRMAEDQDFCEQVEKYRELLTLLDH